MCLSTDGDDSTDTFKIQYTQKHTSLFIDQAYQNSISGFKPNSLGADPNWGKCLQCAAIDRSRFKLSPVPDRSQFCAQCFQQYCFDPAHPPSKDEIPGRKSTFKDPDPQGLDKVTEEFAAHKGLFALVAVGIAALLGALIGICICLRKRRKAREHVYKPVVDQEPWRKPPALQGSTYKLPAYGGGHDGR
jgi:lysophospholipase